MKCRISTLGFAGLIFAMSANAAVPFTHGLIVRLQPQTKPMASPGNDRGAIELAVVRDAEVIQVMEYVSGQYSQTRQRTFLRRFFSERGYSPESVRIVGVASCAAGVCKKLSGVGISGRSPAF